MKKSDLKSGMTVQLRNGKHYIVLLGTGMGEEYENVLYGRKGFWMPLCDYDDRLCCIPDTDDVDDLFLKYEDCVKIAREFDIMKVYVPIDPFEIGNVNECKLVYDRYGKEVS